MAEQGRHLARSGQTGGGLQPLLAGARHLFHPPLLADVQKRTHPAGLQALGVDQRGLDDEHGKERAILAHEHRLEALSRRHIAGQPDRLALLVLIHQGRWPIRRWQAWPGQLLGAKAHHRAKRGVDVGGLPLQVARAKPGHQRVFHGFSKCQSVSQVALGLEASTDVFAKHGQNRDQGNGHGGHQRREHIGKQIGRTAPTVQAQHQSHSRQIQQLLRGKNPVAARPCPAHGKPRAVGFGKRHFLAARELTLKHVTQNILQGIGGQQIAGKPTRRHQGQAQIHKLHAKPVGKGHKVAARVSRAADFARGATGLGDVRLGIDSPQACKHRGSKGRVHLRAHRQRGVTPLDLHQLTVFPQHACGANGP